MRLDQSMGPLAGLARIRDLPVDKTSLAVFAGSTFLVVAGIALGWKVRPPANGQRPPRSWMDAFVRWDGNYYRAIAQDGYSYRAHRQSTIHFMPLYPLVSRGVQRLTGLSAEAALVLTSHVCFLAALVLLGAYTERRYGAEAPAARARAVIALGFLPTSVFFHLAYTESLFLLLVLGQLMLIERGAHPLLVALAACLGVVARPVGVAMVLPLALYAWRFGGGGERSAGWVCITVPLALLGLAGFMAYCNWAFADPLAFARGRDDLWRVRARVPGWEKVRLLLSLEPLWGMFVPTSTGYWGRLLTPLQACFNTHLAGPFYLLLALLL